MYTKGPWEWDCGVIPPDGPGRFSDICVDDGGKIIAQFNEFLESAPEEGLANARLIAAAPDLLEAAKAIVELRSAAREYPHDADVAAEIKAFNAIHAAIDKATKP